MALKCISSPYMKNFVLSMLHKLTCLSTDINKQLKQVKSMFLMHALSDYKAVSFILMSRSLKYLIITRNLFIHRLIHVMTNRHNTGAKATLRSLTFKPQLLKILSLCKMFKCQLLIQSPRNQL